MKLCVETAIGIILDHLLDLNQAKTFQLLGKRERIVQCEQINHSQNDAKDRREIKKQDHVFHVYDKSWKII